MLDNTIFILYNVRVSKNSPIFDIWPHGQSVKTSPFHGGVRGSTPLEATTEKKLRFCLVSCKHETYRRWCLFFLFLTPNVNARKLRI